MPKTGWPDRSKAISVPQAGMPEMKDLVPSMGSSTQTYSASARTECAPAVAVNTYDFRAAGFRQVGAKRGKIGHPVPGMSVRIAVSAA